MSYKVHFSTKMPGWPVDIKEILVEHPLNYESILKNVGTITLDEKIYEMKDVNHFNNGNENIIHVRVKPFN